MSEMQAQCWICPQCYDDKNHTPGDTHCLQEQKREAMAIARLNQLESRKLQEQLTAAQSDNDALRARAAELNACINHAFHIASAKPQDYAIMMALGPNASEAWLLRQHAEAVEALAAELQGSDRYDKKEFRRGMATAYGYATGYAQRLRQQADKIEKAGGGQ